MTDQLITAKNLSKTYKMGKVDVPALNNVSFSIERGSFTSIIGASGSGKSTLLNLLGLIDVPSNGSLSINGTHTNNLSSKEQTKLRGESIGFIFQSFHLIPVMNVLDNVKFQLYFKKTPKKIRNSIANNALKKVGLETHLNHYPADLSGGQRQRVSIARAISKDPDIILADEPTGSLDSKSGSEVIDIFKKFNEQGKTIIIVTHDLEIASITNKQLILKDGKLIQIKTNHVSELRDHYYNS